MIVTGVFLNYQEVVETIEALGYAEQYHRGLLNDLKACGVSSPAVAQIREETEARLAKTSKLLAEMRTHLPPRPPKA